MNWTEQIAAAFSWLPTEPNVMFDGWGLAVAAPLLGWLYARFRKPNAAAVQHDASDWLAKNRHRLCRRFQNNLDDRRRSFLLGKESLELDKILAPEQVEHPHSLQDSIACTLERDGLAVETTGQPIAALFNRPEVGRRLAILGEPGSGKTVCLLKLCGHLLHEAETDELAPLPVVFECSEWDGRDLLSWMAWQLRRKHNFPEDTARQLVQTGDIFPLFDGLDELAAERQKAFVQAFNAFAEGRHVVLCCRLEEYRQLRKTAGQKLALNNAAILQDILPQKLKGHLYRQGLDELWNQIEQSESLLHLAKRPLFLGLMTAVADKLRQGSQIRQGETWEDCIWRLYLDLCLREKQSNCNQSPDCHGKKYTKEQSMHWLSCLARWMQAEQKVELWIDELQPSMLKHHWWFGLFYVLVYVLFFGMTGWLFKGPIRNASVGILMGLEVGLFFWLYFMRTTFNAKLSRYLLVAMPLSCFTALVYALVQVQRREIGQMLAVMIAVGLFAALFDGLLKWLKSVDGKISESIHLKELLYEVLHSSLLLFPILTFISIMLFFIAILLAKQIGFDVDHSFEVNGFYLVLFGTAASSFFVLRIDGLLQHRLLRLCLHIEGQLPLRLVPWLEAMQQRKVLQRAGGSCHFLHKQLQEYLAKQMEMEN